MHLPDPLSIDRARGLLDLRFDKDIAKFLGITLRVLGRRRECYGGMLSVGQRAQVEAHLLRQELHEQSSRP